MQGEAAMKRYYKYIKPYWPYFILGPILMIVEVIGEIILPRLMANILNIGVANHNVSYILQTGGVMVIICAGMLLGGVGGAYFGIKASVNFATDLRKDLFAKIQQFSFSNIDEFRDRKSVV